MGIARSVVEFGKDLKAFGLSTAVQGLRRSIGHGTITLNLPGIGAVVVRRRDSDYESLRQVLRDREYSINNPLVDGRLAERYHAILSRGQVPVIVDAGANIGVASIWFKTLYPDAAVVAVEPDPGNAAVLRQNLARYPRVSVLEAAIGSDAGFASLMPGDDRSWAVQTRRAEAGCPIVTINQAIATVPNGTLFIAKVDIEGFEQDLFAGNLDWIAKAFAIFIEPHDWMRPGQHTSRGFQQALGAEFELFLRGDNLLYVRPA